MGIALSDSWRVGRAADVVIEGQIGHGSPVSGIGVNAYTLLAGIRGSGRSRYGTGTSAFGQVLAGFEHRSANVTFYGDVDFGTQFALQPGFGVEVPASRQIAIRPQFDTVFLYSDGEFGHYYRFNVNVVFRLFKEAP